MDLPCAPRCAAALVASSVLCATPQAEAGIGRTPGFASVSPDGQALYTIPLTLPPGTNGMTPVLSLDYSHRNRGGLLGVGWSIGGLSQITRCAKNHAQDGVADPPALNIFDRYCLDGQRLVGVAGGLGTAAAEYRSEIESFARIRAFAGSSAFGPAWFTVEAADGRIYEYGATSDSSIEGSTIAPAGGARTWALNRIRDRSGNVIDYRYTEETASTAYRIASIRYNANPAKGAAASHEVLFVYEARPNREVDAGYVAGTPVREVMRLDRIDVRYGSEIIRRYDLAYEPALSSGGRSRLASVRECGAGGSDCFAPTTFEWQDGAPGLAAPVAFPVQLPPGAFSAGADWNIVDINGDGRNDYVWAAGASLPSAKLHYRLSMADGAFGPVVNSGIPCPAGIGSPFDANGDGHSDLLIAQPAGHLAIAHGSASGLGPALDVGFTMPAGSRSIRGADLNGDGLGDVAWVEVPDPMVNSLRVRARYAKGSGGFGAPVTLYTQFDAVGYENPEGGDFFGVPGRRVDLDGDGAEELLMNENFSVARISDARFATDRFDSTFRGGTPLDFNDDGCTDFAYRHQSRFLRVRLSRCNMNSPTTELQGPAWAGNVELQALDWNGDGREDILVRGDSNFLVSLSLGDALAPLADTGVAHGNAEVIAGRDIDGDGLEDLAFRTAAQIQARMQASPVPDLLVMAEDGFGVEGRFAYRPLTDASVYARGSSARWPDQDAQTNDLVVSKLAATDGTGRDVRFSTTFRYEGLRRNAQGRGFLGFRKVTRTELSSAQPLSMEMTQRQDFPFTGLPESTVVRQATGKTVSATEYRWSSLDLGTYATGSVRFPHPTTITMRRFEAGGTLDGAEIARSVFTVDAIDRQSGLVTDQTTTATEIGGGTNAGSSASLRTLHTDVLNDKANWCLGRSQAVQLTASHTLSGGAAVTRSADQEWSAAECRPTRLRLFPGDSQWQLTYDFAYDDFGNIAQEKVTGAGMAARTVAMTWDARGQLPVQVANPLGQASRYTWDEATGVLLTIKDPNGLGMAWTYDAFGRPTLEKQADGTRTRWTIEGCKGQCDARARYRIYQEDLDRLQRMQAAAWLEVDQHGRGFRLESLQAGGGRAVTSFDYDTKGRISRRYLPFWDGGTAPGYEGFDYDALGRLVSQRLAATGDGSERTTAIRYDGLSVTQTDALGRSTTGTRNAWGRLAEIVDALGGRTRYEYDAFGGLLRVRDAEGNAVASITRNPRGMRVGIKDMDRGSWAFTPNALGEIAEIRNAKGQVARFEYDPLGRISRRTNPDGVSNWSWGTSASKKDIGRLAALSGPGYSESFTYDALGRPATHVIAADATYQFDYAYNDLGLLDTITYPAAGSSGRFTIRHGYEAGRVKAVSDAGAPGGPLWSLNTQDAAGYAIDETLGTSIRVISGVSPVSGELEYRLSGKEGATPEQDQSFAWDAAGNLASRRDLGRGLLEEFRYDALDRLVQSRRNGAVNLELDYDAIGNIRRKSDVCAGTTACFRYHATRKHAVTSAGGIAYAYDANGNMQRRGGKAITWNADDLPVSIVQAGGNQSVFSYGPDGNRWRQAAKHGSTTETTVYAGGLFEKVTRNGTTTWRHYVTSPGGTAVHLRYGDGTPPATRYLTLDHLGSTDHVFEADGNALVSASFGAFGERRNPAWSGTPTAADLEKFAGATRDGFTGHEQLDNLGLVHMNGRVYDPRLGRFLSADPYVTIPYDGQGLNRYAYALNNPLAFTDPSGFDPVPCLATQEGHCVQITVIAASWPTYLRASGGAHANEIASALERDPCGQNGSATACAMQGVAFLSPSSVVLTIGSHPDPALSSNGRLDAVQGFAARVANLAISSSPIALLFGADPDFQYFREPESAYGAGGAKAGNVGYFLGGAAGVIRKGASELASRSPSAIARSFQGHGRYPGVDRFKDITLKKGTIIYAGYPGQSMFYTTASAMRRAGRSSDALFKGLQVAAHKSKGLRVRAAAYEVLEDTPAAFALALANLRHGHGSLPQVVVPSYMQSIRYLNDFPLGF